MGYYSYFLLVSHPIYYFRDMSLTFKNYMDFSEITVDLFTSSVKFLFLYNTMFCSYLNPAKIFFQDMRIVPVSVFDFSPLRKIMTPLNIHQPLCVPLIFCALL